MGLREAMHSRRLRIVLWMLVFLLAVLLPALVSRGADTGELWNMAVKLAVKNADLYPGSIVQQEILRLNDGTVVRDSETNLILYNEDGRVGVDVVSVVVNGKDVTGKARRNLSRSDVEIDHTVEHPFMAEAQENIQFTPSSLHAVINGRRCVKYSFSFSDDESEWKGRTWIEKDTGIPVQTEASLASVPFVEEEVTVTALHTVTEYGHGSGDRWFPARLQVDAKIEFQNGAPGGKRSGTSATQRGTVTQELVFDNFWRLQ